MKSKHIGLAGLLVAGVALLAVVTQLLWASWHQVRPFAMGRALESYSSARLMVDVAAVTRMDLVEPTLPNLVKLERMTSQNALAAVSDVDYAMFGERPPVVRTVEPPPAPERKRAELYAYRVSMTYISGDYRYAVVNKKLYRQGARLPNGEKLAEISASAVRITDSEKAPRWISVRPAGQSRRVTPDRSVMDINTTTATNRRPQKNPGRGG